MKFNKHVLMAEEGGGENPSGGTGGENPSGDPAPTGENPPSGLPSEQGDPASFEIKPEDLTDGKFQGKWSNPQEMADYIKTIEDKHANLTREVANTNKQTDAEIQQTADELQASQLKEDTVKSLLPEFIKNGMVITDTMKEELTKVGLTEQEIKLGAYEFKESLDLNASYVGGKENYDIIMNYHAENMTDDEKRAFNHSIQDPKNSEALMVGLQAIYERKIGETPAQETPDRVRGNAPANTNSIKAYETKAELLKDKRYADSRVASSADKARFRARLNATPDNVWRS